MLRNIILTALLITTTNKLSAEEVPRWVLQGILHVESRSYYSTAGSIVYRDRRIGAAGERGPFQITWAAFKQVIGNDVSRFKSLHGDTRDSEYVARLYLMWLRTKHAKNWHEAIHYYNAGPGNKSPKYYSRVIEASGRVK